MVNFGPEANQTLLNPHFWGVGIGWWVMRLRPYLGLKPGHPHRWLQSIYNTITHLVHFAWTQTAHDWMNEMRMRMKIAFFSEEKKWNGLNELMNDKPTINIYWWRLQFAIVCCTWDVTKIFKQHHWCHLLDLCSISAIKNNHLHCCYPILSMFFPHARRQF